MFRKLSILLIVLTLLAGVTVPSNAQTPTTDLNELVVVAGPVDLGQGVIMVTNYLIVPSTGLQPPILQEGDEIVVIGYLQPDGVTIVATSLELFDDTNPPPIEVIEESTEEPTAEVTLEPTAEVTAEPTPPSCSQPGQPVAQRLADAFGVPYAEVMGWHCQAFGFGEIARAYLLADSSGLPASTYFAQRQAGIGWGEIVKAAGVHPSTLAPGQVIRPQHDSTDDQPGSSGHGNGNGNGHSNGNGKNNGSNGHGNGHG